MPENTESGRRRNWDDGETEKKSCSRQNEVGTKPETKEASAEPAEWIPMLRRGPALRPSPGLAANGARYRACPPFQAPPPAAQLDFQNQGATNRNATHPCGPRPYACRKSVRLQNVRLRSGRPRRRAAPLPVRADTLQPPKLELCASAAQGRQFVWPWPSPSPGNLFPVYSCSRAREYGAEGNRTFSWLQNYRRLLIRRDRLLTAYSYSALASFRIGMSGSASFRSARKSW
jgi:hypothetical protein